MSDLTPKESAIMRLWDTGSPLEAIACAMGMPKANVEKVVFTFHDGGDERRQVAVMRRGSAFLLRAIQISGKRHRNAAQ